MVRFSQILSRVFVCSLISVVLAGCSYKFERFWEQPESRIGTRNHGPKGTEMRFLGVSSFLLRDGQTQIMIDGFMSRPEAALIARIQPRQDVVRESLDGLEVQILASCDDPIRDGAHLDAILAVHGHYDHALDTPLIAMLTGAKLIADNIVQEIAGRTADLYPNLCSIKMKERIQDFEFGDQQTFTVGSVTLRLIRVPHSDNPASTLLEAWPKNPKWKFPTLAKNLKEGTGVAVHITTRAGTILIVPTAGLVEDMFRRPELSADILFLGVGGVGWESEADAKAYFNGTILASGARYVVPIHWDAHSPPLDADQEMPPIPLYENLDRTLKYLDDFARDCPQVAQDCPHFELASVPLFGPFDPFSSTSMRKLP